LCRYWTSSLGGVSPGFLVMAEASSAKPSKEKREK